MPGWLTACGVMLCVLTQSQAAWAADAPGERETVARYARRFDNDYLAARRGHPIRRPPYDATAVDNAQAIHDDALNACENRRGEFSTASARIECYLDADRQFAATAKVDATLFATFEAAVRRADADSDSGRLPPAQLDNVYFTLTQAYAAIIHDQAAAWKNAHPPPP